MDGGSTVVIQSFDFYILIHNVNYQGINQTKSNIMNNFYLGLRCGIHTQLAKRVRADTASLEAGIEPYISGVT